MIHRLNHPNNDIRQKIVPLWEAATNHGLRRYYEFANGYAAHVDVDHIHHTYCIIPIQLYSDGTQRPCPEKIETHITEDRIEELLASLQRRTNPAFA